MGQASQTPSYIPTTVPSIQTSKGQAGKGPHPLKPLGVEHSLQRRRLWRTFKVAVLTLTIYGVTLVYVFPILYMFLTGFKTEQQAVNPALWFTPTLETFRRILSGPGLYTFLGNSLFQVVLGTLLSLLLGVPAAFALVFGRFRREETRRTIYFWFVTTILLPPVAVIIPLYTWYQRFGLNQVPQGLLLAYVGFHVPIVVWLVYSFFNDIPREVMEASAIDGCNRLQQLVLIALPLARAGIVASGLLVAVFIWNEFFLGFNLTNNATATLPVYMARFREQQGLFTAQLSASASLAVLPALILGWLSQRSLVKGLTAGAVKG